tara:strand:- start:68 stop:859 length:792 start_codon:yes stop_codon:yes gene_type:complete
MELPSDIWKEILTYCNNSVEHQIKEMSFENLQKTIRETSGEITSRLEEMKSKINCYDIIKFKRRKCPEVPEAYAFVLSKARDNIPYTLRVIIMTPSDKNTQFGYYKPINTHYIFMTKLYLDEITFDIDSHFKDIINANKLIAKSTKVGDVVEITPSLFTSGCRYDCIHYGVVSTKYSYNTIEVQTIRLLFNDYIVGDKRIVFEGYMKMNTKNILKHINLDDETDINDFKINNYKQHIKDNLNHRRKFIDVINTLKESLIILNW